MQKIIQELTQNPVSVIISVFGILLSIFIYFRSKRKKSLVFFDNSIAIFKNNTPLISNLQVQYKGVEIKNLSITHLAFWNNGNETIRNEDLVENDYFRINVREGSILDSKILYVSNKANNITLANIDEANVNINFQFLDGQQGGVLRIVHTASGLPPKKCSIFNESPKKV